jgi:outer membrane protein OmpA-like peptidoglycan-associated protein
VHSVQLVRPHQRASEIRVPGTRPRTLAASVLSLQRSIGNAAVVRLLAREPERDWWEENQPPKFPRQGGDAPGMTGCSVVRKGGGWYVKCEHESGRATPGIPTGAKELEDMLPKSERKQPLGPLTNPDQGPWLRRPPSLAEICESNPKAPVCFKPGPEPAVIPPVGSFNSLDVRFGHNQPSTSQGGTTAEGADSLAYVIERLQADATLQVRLVGHASSEGTAQENLQLSVRRAKAIYAALAAKGLGSRVMDLVGGREPTGCTRVEFGIWACGASQAAEGEVRPEDRKVAVTFLRNAPVP